MTSQWCHRNKTHSWYSELNSLQNVYFGLFIFGKLTEWRCFVTYLSNDPRISNCLSELFQLCWKYRLISFTEHGLHVLWHTRICNFLILCFCAYAFRVFTLLVGLQERHSAYNKQTITNLVLVCWWFDWSCEDLNNSGCHHCHLQRILMQKNPGWFDTLLLAYC